MKSNLIFFSPAVFVNDPFDIEIAPVFIDFESKKNMWEFCVNQVDEIKKGNLDVSDLIEKGNRYEDIVDPKFHFNCLLETANKSNNYRWELNDSVVASLRNNFFFVALSYMDIKRSNDALLLWSHYSDSHRGIAFCLSFSDDVLGDGKFIVPIDYSKQSRGTLFSFDDYVNFMRGKIDPLFYEKYLHGKHEVWKYENEYRAYGENGEGVVLAKTLESVYLGCECSKQNESWVLELVKKFCPRVSVYKVVKDIRHLKLKYELIYSPKDALEPA